MIENPIVEKGVGSTESHSQLRQLLMCLEVDIPLWFTEDVVYDIGRRKRLASFLEIRTCFIYIIE